MFSLEHKPHPLFDTIIRSRELKSDGQLAKLLNISRPTISKVRHGKQVPSAEVILAVHEATDMPVSEIRKLIAAA